MTREPVFFYLVSSEQYPIRVNYGGASMGNLKVRSSFEPLVREVSSSALSSVQDVEDSVKPYSWLAVMWLSLVAVSLFAVKLFFIQDIPASALFADDYNNLNHGRYFAQGILHPSEDIYPYSLIKAGIAYQMLITPWVLFDFPERLWFVFSVNALLSVVMVVFGTFAVWNVSEKRSLLVPAALAVLASPFMFTYYVMTENLVFALVAVLAWLASDFRKTMSSRGRFISLFVVAIALPLTRTPGFAVLPAILLLFWRHRNDLGYTKTVLVSCVLVATVLGAYLGYSSLYGSGVSRDSKYVDSFSAILLDIQMWPVIGRVVLSQLGYLAVCSVGWGLSLFLLAPVLFGRGGSQRRLLDVYWFSAVSAGFFIAFSTIHTSMKAFQTGGNGWFIYGRYDDPAVVLLVIGGLSLLCSLRDERWFSRLVLALMTIATLGVSLYYVSDIRWGSINFAGLSFYSLPKRAWMDDFAIALVCLSFLGVLVRGVRVPLLLMLFIVFQSYSVWHGLASTSKRAKRVDYVLSGAYWLEENASETDTICFDWPMSKAKARGGIKRFGNAFRALIFRTSPMPFIPLREMSNVGSCTYVYTFVERAEVFKLPAVWENEGYAILSTKATAKAG